MRPEESFDEGDVNPVGLLLSDRERSFSVRDERQGDRQGEYALDRHITGSIIALASGPRKR